MSDHNLLGHATAETVRLALDDVGTVVGCWRLSRHENNRDFGWRLALHIQETIIAREQLLDIVLSLSKSPTCNLDGDERA